LEASSLLGFGHRYYGRCEDHVNQQERDFICEFIRQQNLNFDINKAHGFEEDADFNFGEKLALVHGELSEALEYYRKGNGPSDHIPEFSGVEEEFADVFIRLMNMAVRMKLRLPEAMIAKQAFNAARPFKHGGKKF
jgi:NTP pyrophosphatase (non-canonical NTP hydrolase)